ncbi:MAG: hypothetical protein NVSMB64_06280 [Candidatus Velthaea sp.]
MPEVIAPESVQTDAAEFSLADYRKERESGESTAELEAPEKPATPAKEAPAPVETDSESETEKTPETETEKPEKKGGFQKRIDKLTREKSELATQKAELERRLAENPAAKPIEKQPEGKPQASNFDTYEAYTEALTDWKIDQREQARTKTETDRQAANAQKAVSDKFQERIAETRKRYEDFDEVLANADDQPVSAAMNQIILESEHGPEVVYFLAQNLDQAAAIAKLSPLAAARAIGKIEAGFSKPDSETKPAVSKAPPPIKPVGAVAVAAKKYQDMDLNEYRRARESGKLT